MGRRPSVAPHPQSSSIQPLLFPTRLGAFTHAYTFGARSCYPLGCRREARRREARKGDDGLRWVATRRTRRNLAHSPFV